MYNLDNLKGKRFLFSIVAVIAISAVTALLKYDGEIYLKLVGTVTAVFTIGQTITDSLKK